MTGATKAATSSRHAPRPSDDPRTWTEETALYQTGVYGGPLPYTPNEIGGAQRPLNVYHQDSVNRKGKRTAQGDDKGNNEHNGEATCTKMQYPTKKLSPGLLVRPVHE